MVPYEKHGKCQCYCYYLFTVEEILDETDATYGKQEISGFFDKPDQLQQNAIIPRFTNMKQVSVPITL